MQRLSHGLLLPPGLGGGLYTLDFSAIQILYENFVRNLFGVVTDLCR